jgi:hypothetical protein
MCFATSVLSAAAGRRFGAGGCMGLDLRAPPAPASAETRRRPAGSGSESVLGPHCVAPTPPSSDGPLDALRRVAGTKNMAKIGKNYKIRFEHCKTCENIVKHVIIGVKQVKT